MLPRAPRHPLAIAATRSSRPRKSSRATAQSRRSWPRSAPPFLPPTRAQSLARAPTTRSNHQRSHKHCRIRSLRKLPLPQPHPQIQHQHTPAPHLAPDTLEATPGLVPSPSRPTLSGPKRRSSPPRPQQHNHAPPPPSGPRSCTLALTLARIPGTCRAHAPSASPCSAPRSKIPSSSPSSTAPTLTTLTLPPRLPPRQTRRT